MHLNYDYLGRYLASWGYLVAVPRSTDDATLVQVLTAGLTAPERFFAALAGRSAGGRAVIVTRSMGTDRAATLLAAGEDRVSGLVLLGPVTLTALPAVPLLVVGASLDGQSGDSGCASAYAAGENPKFRAVLLGGNHGQFTDLKHWEPLMDGTPTMTRNRQQELVESLTLAFVQRLGGEAESFPQWLTDPGTPAEVTLTSAP